MPNETYLVFIFICWRTNIFYKIVRLHFSFVHIVHTTAFFVFCLIGFSLWAFRGDTILRSIGFGCPHCVSLPLFFLFSETGWRTNTGAGRAFSDLNENPVVCFLVSSGATTGAIECAESGNLLPFKPFHAFFTVSGGTSRWNWKSPFAFVMLSWHEDSRIWAVSKRTVEILP